MKLNVESTGTYYEIVIRDKVVRRNECFESVEIIKYLWSSLPVCKKANFLMKWGEQ